MKLLRFGQKRGTDSVRLHINSSAGKVKHTQKIIFFSQNNVKNYIISGVKMLLHILQVVPICI